MDQPASDDRSADRPAGLFSIGQFSRLTGLTLKAIRLYHERGLLPPSWVDASSGYRYFTDRDVERARAIARLRGLELSLSEIEELFAGYEDSAGTLGFLEAQRQRIAARRQHLGRVARELDRMIRAERDALARLAHAPAEIVELTLAPLLVASLRWKGTYAETGRMLGRLYRAYGRYATAAPLNLYYDDEHKDEEADIESCLPVRPATPAAGFPLRTLSGGACVSLVHRGPYSELGRSYGRLMRYLEQHCYVGSLPVREIYRRGPGMLFKGNPNNYLTELQVLVSS
jgi:DNA-binding transcriptional MerR regulator/effector-binding domain-containing protein